MSTGSNKKFKLRQTERKGLLGLKSLIIDKIRKPSKERLSFSWKKKTTNDDIEILDVDEKESHAKMKFKLPKIRSKKKFAIGTVAVLIVSIFTLLIIPGQNIVKTGAKKFLDSLGIYTQEIRSVEIQSDDYNNPGSWHIDKSAKWFELHKAQITFDVNSIIKTNNNYKDIILVIDTSSSMSGSKLGKVISDSRELVNYVLSDTNNRIAIITFDGTSVTVSKFSNDKNILIAKLNSIMAMNNTNYNVGLKNIDSVMNDYVKESNRDVVALLLTGGYPNDDTSNQIGTYEFLKEKYPYMIINGVQYGMGTDIIDEIKQVTDSQWVAEQSTLSNTLFEAALAPYIYKKFTITDYVDERFRVNSVDDISVTFGNATLTEENGLQKITWNLGKNSYITGGNVKMYINLTLKEEYAETEGFFPTNNKEMIESQLVDDEVKTVNSTKTPVLKGMYEVVYDTNAPEGCTLPTISNEKYFAFHNVTRRTDKLSCNGYLFKGWDVDEKDSEDIIKVNDDTFKMPLHNITMRATWTRQSITKSMDGTVYTRKSLYKVLESLANEGIYAKEYTGAHQDSMDASKSTEKIYHFYGSDDTKGTEILDKNNVIFAGHCWQIIRTTDTGGVKLLYNGYVENGQCLSTRKGRDSYSYAVKQNLSVNYYYGTNYNYNKTEKTFTLTGNVSTGKIEIGQYTCLSTSPVESCSKLYYVNTLVSEDMYNLFLLKSDEYFYDAIGGLSWNDDNENGLLKVVGYMYDTEYSMVDTTSLIIQDERILSQKLKYAKDFVWNGNKYILNDNTAISISFQDITDDTNSNAHYTCFNTTGECTTLAYAFYADIRAGDPAILFYINLENGKSIENVKNEVFSTNTKDTKIKAAVEAWYKKNLLDYDNYIEDTIFCNNRSQANEKTNGWNPEGGKLSELVKFENLDSLGCSNVTDKFSTLNDKAKLKYKVGLTSYPEMYLLGNDNVRKNSISFWLMSPSTIDYIQSYFRCVGEDGDFPYVSDGNLGIRPSISLKPGTMYVDGDGSMANPYIVETD